MPPIYAPLAPPDEDALHRARLLNTEERTVKRITKRLLAPDAPTSKPASTLLTPPPDGDDAPAAAAVEPNDDDDEEDAVALVDTTGSKAAQEKRIDEYRKFREEILLDFAALEANIVRTQLLLTSNAAERSRYAAEKARISSTAASVRANTAELRERLEEAQRTLERRKGWDVLAEKITGNRMLRSREEQAASISKLNAEIAELEEQGREYAATWAERRQQFGRIVDEGMQMLRLIRDEKEEVERREGMEGQEGEDGEDGDGAGSTRGRVSHVGTPRPEGGATPLHPSGVDSDAVDGFLHPRGKSPLRGSSPAREVETPRSSAQVQDDDDADMADEGEVDEDDGTVAATDGYDSTEKGNKMDTS